MRNGLREVLEEAQRSGRGPQHAGLAYERWAPPKPGSGGAGSTEAEQRHWNRWLSWLEKSQEPEGYAVAFARWRDSLRHSPTLTFQVRAASRLLVGHGNPAPTGVGLTLHHTWGVPLLPGTALKGLLAGYVQTLFSTEARLQGVGWRGARMVREPGELYRRLFGAPGVDGAERGASQGGLLFHDALWVSQQGARGSPGGEPGGTMLARDVLTVHQKDWYGGGAWPSDHAAPNPVSFLTIRPGSRFLVALSLAPGADSDGAGLLRWAGERLREALSDWGLGGKTAAGYGRLEPDGPLEDVRLAGLQGWLTAQKEAGTPQRELLGRLEAEWLERLLALPATEREECRHALKSIHVRKPALVAKMQELLARLGQGA